MRASARRRQLAQLDVRPRPGCRDFRARRGSNWNPSILDATLAAMFETRFVIRPTRFAVDGAFRQRNYTDVWKGLENRFDGVPPKGNTNFAWVQHMVHHLAPVGVAGFVLANGSMSSNQSAIIYLTK